MNATAVYLRQLLECNEQNLKNDDVSFKEFLMTRATYSTPKKIADLEQEQEILADAERRISKLEREVFG